MRFKSQLPILNEMENVNKFKKKSELEMRLILFLYFIRYVVFYFEDAMAEEI